MRSIRFLIAAAAALASSASLASAGSIVFLGHRASGSGTAGPLSYTFPNSNVPQSDGKQYKETVPAGTFVAAAASTSVGGTGTISVGSFCANNQALATGSYEVTFKVDDGNPNTTTGSVSVKMGVDARWSGASSFDLGEGSISASLGGTAGVPTTETVFIDQEYTSQDPTVRVIGPIFQTLIEGATYKAKIIVNTSAQEDQTALYIEAFPFVEAL